MRTISASTSVLVVSEAPSTPVPQVLGAATCAPLITSYLKKGAQNDRATVNRLQQFLHDVEGEEGVAITGVYDAATIAAVKRFQEKHANEILSPWGLRAPTGAVYYTTARVVNVLSCGSGFSFTLTPAQVMEIASYREGKLVAGAIGRR